MRFVNRQTVADCLDRRNSLKNLRHSIGMNLRFFENLCTSNQECLRMCKWLKDNGLIHDYFLRNGFVKGVEEENSRPFKLRHPEIIRQKFEDVPDFHRR